MKDVSKALDELLEGIKAERISISRPGFSGAGKPKSAKERIEQAKADGLEQDVKLKRITLFILFGFLALETLAIFVFAFFQATSLFNFKLEEWSFKLLVTATILQITYMLQVAVKHLFPTKTGR